MPMQGLQYARSDLALTAPAADEADSTANNSNTQTTYQSARKGQPEKWKHSS